MTHHQAIQFAISTTCRRIEDMQELVKIETAHGNRVRARSAENFRNGLIECHDLLIKLCLLVDMTGGKPSVKCEPSK